MGKKRKINSIINIFRPRPRYFMLSFVIALAISGILTFMICKPSWESSFSYQYSPSSSAIFNISEIKPYNTLTQQSDSTDPVSTQVEIIRSEKFIREVQTGLKQQGLGKWPLEDIAKSLAITNPLQSGLIQVDIKTPHKEATQTIALLLHQAYSRYLEDFQKELYGKEKAFIENSLKETRTKLVEGEKDFRSSVASNPLWQNNPFTENPDWQEKTFTQEYADLSRQIRETEVAVALEDTRYKNYQSLLNKDEKTLIQGVILGEDPTLLKMAEQLAMAETDANILSVKYSPETDDGKAKLKTLQQQMETHRQKLLNDKLYQGKPVIRDSVRKNLVEDMISSKVKLLASKKALEVLKKQQNDLFDSFKQVASAPYDSWIFQKNMLQNTLTLLEKRSTDLNNLISYSASPVKLFQEIPAEPSITKNHKESAILFLSVFSGLFGMMSAMPFMLNFRPKAVQTKPILDIVTELLNTKEQQVIMMLPVHAGGHLNTSTHLGGLLNQFGKDALVIDIDLRHRLLSRKIPLEHPHGVLEHLITEDLKKPYMDPLSGARILPLEATLEADRIVEFSQIIQRLPRLWERWSGSIVILDISQWHEAYHQLLPYIAEVVFYVPPSSQSNILLPRVFQDKYKVPVSLIEIQPEL